MDAPTYVHLEPGKGFPRIGDAGPFKAVLVVEADDVSPDWQASVSEWLVRNNCRYAVVWGHKCSEWHDAIDDANLRLFDYAEIPDDKFVMTTWHDEESLEEAFRFAAHAAMHPALDLKETHIIHIAPKARSAELLESFRQAQAQP